MGTLSVWHILVIAVVVLAVFGHREIPALFGTAGRFIKAARRLLRAAKTPPSRPPGDVIEGTYVRRDD
jgi:Sec-independent protein translocase protein TatA